MRLLMGIVLAASAWSRANAQGAPEFVTKRGVKLNEIQVLGSHNSYAQPVDPKLLAVVEPILGKLMSGVTAKMPPAQAALFKEEHPNEVTFAEALNYHHPDLTTQLNAGLRSLEIDVNPDPEGGRFVDPAGYRALRAKGVQDLAPHNMAGLEQPGFKVLHVPDIDFRSHCPTFKGCLAEIKAWSEAHPQHVPLYIMLEAKSQAIPIFPGATQVAPFDAKAFDALDAEILSVLGRNRLITPDDVRGTYDTLRQAVLAKNWPTLEAARGKVIFLMITANGTASTGPYLEGHASLKGRVAFLRAEPGDDHAAFLMYDNAVVRAEEIQKFVQAGYLVRTRSDIETYEAKANDLSRAKAAFSSGAQVVSTDFFRPGNSYGTPYVVQLPGGGVARCNPVVRAACQ